jgi:hypothetical protein
VKPTREHQKRFDAAMAEIASLPQDRQIDALLHYLSTVLLQLPLAELHRRRDQLLERFADCGCSYEACTALLEMVDQHLAHRARSEARQAAATRKAAPRAVKVSLPPSFLRLDPPKNPGPGRGSRR